VTGFPQRPHREQLGHDSQGNLLRAVGTDIQSHRPEHAPRPFTNHLLENPVGTSPRAEESDIGNVRTKKVADPFEIVHERVSHDDGVDLRPEKNAVDAFFGAPCDQMRGLREPFRLEISLSMIYY